MRIELQTITLESDDMREWESFCKVIEVMEPEYVFGILEQYDLENWL